jgi:site-specific recombinase XerC
MASGRKRIFDPAIPSHIDQVRIPKGIYWDRSGRGRWFIFEPAGDGRVKRRTVATAEARTSDLHRIVEEMQGIDRGTLGWLLDQFNSSQKFLDLAPRTRANYNYQRDIARAMPTKLGKPLGELSCARMTPPLMQRLVDRIAEDGTPTKANHLLRYLRRVFHWGVNRGHCKDNPARGVEQAKERRLRRLPTTDVMNRIVGFARERGALKPHTRGSCAPYLWIAMELAYLCRLRGIEVVTLSDANAVGEGVLTNRRKGSRDNIVRWTARLRAAWDAAAALRTAAIARTRRPSAIKPEARMLFVSEDGTPLRKSSFDTAWQRLITMAIRESVIAPEQRFGPHDLKRKGISSTRGTRDVKKEASGHRSDAMLDVYDLSVPIVDPASED